MQFSNCSLPTSSSIQLNCRIGKLMDMVNSEDKGCGKPLYENNLTITLPFRLDMSKIMESVPENAHKIKSAQGKREATAHCFYPKNPRSHQIRLVSSRFKPIEGGV